MKTQYLLRRVAFVVFVAYLLLSVTFFFVALTPDPNEVMVQAAAAMGGGDGEQALQGYRAARNRDVPLLERYTSWLVAYTTFQWGTSFTVGKPVLSAIGDRLLISLAYVVPGLAMAAWGGVAIGMWNAIRPQSIVGRGAAATGVLLGAIPSYWLGHLTILFGIFVLDLSRFYRWTEGGPLAPANAPKIVFAAVTIAAALLVVQLRYVRSGTAEFVRTEAAKLVRGKGGGDATVSRHALRLLGSSFLTLFLTEALTVLFLGMYVVEAVFHIPGFGDLSLLAIEQRDIPLILGTTFIPIVFGLCGTLVQDVVEVALDPRVGE